MIEKHGADAATIAKSAGLIAREMGSRDRAAKWERVAAAIEVLQRAAWTDQMHS
jgi:hypothetical protein